MPEIQQHRVIHTILHEKLVAAYTVSQSVMTVSCTKLEQHKPMTWLLRFQAIISSSRRENLARMPFTFWVLDVYVPIPG